ncbi:SAM-dependent methyltransferase [Undibacterium jejuense]|uniref:SAM-dependent methyltransferase n=1 Tax=Undibacterium jejuense TaxID=1344949 RepID=A0A923HED2_9BURK|nr:SAM-dependent methyltransferase [Undibacterium jejuense]MBC3862224.1 SAM-dependent methyltransferase [Undibacterium jejuense]
MLIITIKQGKEKALLAGEPWVYLSAISRIDGKFEERLKSGATTLIRSSSGQFLARGGWSPKSQIRARIWTLDEKEAVDHAMIKRRIQHALTKPRPVKNSKTAAQRLINAEADQLPGLVVDYYGENPGYLVCQFQAACVDAWKVTIVKALIAETGCPNVYEHADELIRAGEGLPANSGSLAGDELPIEFQFE